MTQLTVPVAGDLRERPFEGTCARKPWEHEVTAVIPTLNSHERLELVVELLRLQTVRPFIVVVDTGSAPGRYDLIESMRAEDLEVHQMRLNGVEHSSEPVAMAMDWGLARCPTRFMFCTHDDCFLMSRETLRIFRDHAAQHVAAGHRLTRRPHDDWNRMVGHTALMLDADWIRDHGVTWDMRRAVRRFGTARPRREEQYGNWPDTEIGLNYLLWSHGVKPYITGEEQNFARNTDGLIDHCRSTGSASLYSRGYATLHADRLSQAMIDAQRRVSAWRSNGWLEAPPLPAVPPTRVQNMPSFSPGNL